MDCKTCTELIFAYRCAVRLFREAVENIPGTREDSSQAVRNADALQLKCREASDRVMEHWREHHGNDAKLGF
jgi:hypothetical protein